MMANGFRAIGGTIRLAVEGAVDGAIGLFVELMFDSIGPKFYSIGVRTGSIRTAIIAIDDV